MDRKQRDSLADLLEAHASFVITAHEEFETEEFDEAKAEFYAAAEAFRRCEPEQPVKVEVVNLTKSALL